MSTCDAWNYCSPHETMRGDTVNKLRMVRGKVGKYRSSSLHWVIEPNLEPLCLWTSSYGR